MKGINKVILIGNVGKDPEIRYQPSGAAVAILSLATTETWNKDGQQQKKTEWHRLVAFGKVAEIIGQYVKTGTTLYIEGKLQTRKWQGQDGKDRYTTEINVRDIQFLGGKQKKDKPQQQSFQKPAEDANPPQDFDDSIPF